MLSLEFNSKYRELHHKNFRYVHLWGGRGRGGSFTATQYALDLITRDQYFRGYIMREIAEDIRESLWRDFKDRIEAAECEDQIYLNDSAMTAYCPNTGNHLLSKGFKKSSGKRTAKLKSLAGATHVIIEEAEEISEEDFNQLDDTLRTVKANVQIILIFNPPSKNHWIWKKWYNLIDSEEPGYYRAIPKQNKQLLSIFSDYHDNEINLNETTIENFEDYKIKKPEHYFTMIKGLISEGVKGRIYKDWKPILSMPNEYTKFYGLDWGFNDPLAIVECEVHNDNLYIKEVVYGSGLSNNSVNQMMLDYGMKKSDPIFADKSPKDVADLESMGWNIVSANKGPGSILAGIRFIKKYTVHLTENSVNLWKENENYKWRLDQFKEPLEEPEDKNNHGMDAIRYAMEHLMQPRGQTGFGQVKAPPREKPKIQFT